MTVLMSLTWLFTAGLAAQTAQVPPLTSDALGQAYFLFLQGRQLDIQGQTEPAIAIFRKAIAIAPGAADIRAELAGVYARADRVSEAMAEAETALGVDPANREAHRILGLIQAALANRPGANRGSLVGPAIGHLERSLAGGVRDPGAELTLARLYVRDRQHAKAIATLRTFLLDRPGYPEALLLLAEAYEGSGLTADAVALLEQLARAAPEDVRVRLSLAEGYERTRQWKEAAAIWADLIRRGPRASALYRSRYAAALVNSGETARGRQELVELTKQSPRDISGWYLLSQVERSAGDVAAAEEAARQIVAIDAADARGPLALAGARAARGDYRGAVSALEPGLAAARADDIQNGSYALMAAEMAGALQALGERSRAVRVLEQARQRDAGSVDLAFDLAAAYERDGRLDDAERSFREVIANDPTHAGALNYLGYMLADRGRKLDEAIDFIKRALAVDAGNPAYLDSLGWAYFKQGKLHESREPLERAASASQGNSVIQEHLGDLYVELKRYRDAVGAFDRALAGDRQGIDVAAVTRKRDRARELAGK